MHNQEATDSENWRGVPIAVTVSILFFIWCIPIEGLYGDLEFWRDWIQQMLDGGLPALQANYPPLFLEWLWLVTQIYQFFDLTPVNGTLLKAWVVIPVIWAQLLIVLLIARMLANAGHAVVKHPVFWLTAFNPVFLLDGPIWGQVDMVPMVFIAIALYLYQQDAKNIFWLPMLGVLAVLSKFQAIVFAPLFFALGLKDIRRMLLGLIPAIMTGIIVLLPFWYCDVLAATLHRAYFANLSIYPYSTLNAANFWHLLGQDRSPDNLIIFSWQVAGRGFEELLTVKTVGMTIFIATSLIVFYRTLRTQAPVIYVSALLLLVAFFVFAPGMHERYFFPGVVIAAMAAASDKKYFLLYVVITILTFLNIQLVHAVRGAQAWHITSWAFVLLVPWVLWYSFADVLSMNVRDRISAIMKRLLSQLEVKPIFLYALVLIWSITTPLFEMWQQNAMVSVAHRSGILRLSDLKPVSAYQEWGQMRENVSVDGNPLRVAGRAYAYGIGTHARSVIKYKIPKDAIGFTSQVGIDDETAGGSVIFSILVDDRLAWTSELITNGKIETVADVDIKSDDEILTLMVDPQGQNNGDHADWLEPSFIFLNK